ncbi:hypothetical protein [Streptomyces sp. V1I1]|uniref:hypothetical protein n=1 Tax=Streptomyces sp. V1I1 TaxID=3042272 RepID=UPI00278B58E9|nr:hypothetical protein [Streptomyces sp. V1I1]MDQ0943317.1 hypothetical protein [Streptomyces sp. V1I1]
MSAAREAAIQAVKDHPSTTFMAPYESLADAVLAAARPLLRAEVLREGADAVVAENDRMLWATKPGKHWAADRLRRMADEAEQGQPAPQPATIENYPGELATLRGVLGVVRTIARHGDFADTEGVRELRRIITEHYADERAAYAEQEKDTREGESTPQPAELTIYRASHESIVFGRYTNRAAARAHCETLVRREVGEDVFLGWVPDHGGEDAPEELCTGEDVECTGYVVTPLTVASEYDAEADE